MGLYSRYILPRVVHFTCGLKPNMRQREKVVPRARGRVLEVGIGSGLNLPYYDSAKVSKVWGLDPSPEMTRMARRAAGSLPFEVEFIGLPGGELIFCEHGAAPDASVRRWQDRLNPLWQRLGGGCNLNRPIPAMIEAGGFQIKSLDTMYLPGWRPASFNYWGIAVAR